MGFFRPLCADRFEVLLRVEVWSVAHRLVFRIMTNRRSVRMLTSQSRKLSDSLILEPFLESESFG